MQVWVLSIKILVLSTNIHFLLLHTLINVLISSGGILALCAGVQWKEKRKKKNKMAPVILSIRYACAFQVMWLILSIAVANGKLLA